MQAYTTTCVKGGTLVALWCAFIFSAVPALATTTATTTEEIEPSLVTLASTTATSSDEGDEPSLPPPMEALSAPVALQESTSCGTITTSTTTFEIEDCDNPFGRTASPSPIGLVLDEVSVIPDGIVGITGTIAEKVRIPNRRHRYDYVHRLFEHLEADFFEKDFTPTFPEEEPTEEEWRNAAHAYFTPGTDIEPYVLAGVTGEIGHLTDDEVDIYDEFEYNFFNEFYQEQYPALPLGTYTLVSEEQFPCLYPCVPEAGDIFTLTFTVAQAEPEPTGASNILFLPGIKASRLYTYGDRLWEPNEFSDAARLAMTSAGESIEDIYVDDVMDTVTGLGTVYADFLGFLDELKNEEIIADWDVYAYDWRDDVFTIAAEGAKYETYIRQLDQILALLSETAPSKKVTIVAHSNGGLLAKALLIGHPELATKIDKIIFVGTPQLGTPEAIGALLHGYKQRVAFGFLLSEEEARDLSLHFPGAYGLLPGEAYLDTTTTPVVGFDPSSATSIFEAAYGAAVVTQNELKDFLLGNEGRSEAGSVSDAAKLDSTIYETAMLQRSLLDSWVAPEGIEVVEIVGVGLDTVAGFFYEGFQERLCVLPGCPSVDLYKPVPNVSVYGDKTVMSASAGGYSGDSKKYYFNLKDSLIDGKEYEHYNLTESDTTQALVKSIIDGEEQSLTYVSQTAPDFDALRTMIGVHSPATLRLRDEDGREVGVEGGQLVEEIPHSTYLELGDSKYIIVPADTEYEVEITGTGEGGLTLTVDELEENDHTRLLRIPIDMIHASTSISFSHESETFSNITIDIDGDGTTDVEMTPEGEIVVDEPEPASYPLLIGEIKQLSLKKKYEKPLLQAAESAQRASLHARRPLLKIVEHLLLGKLELLLRVYEHKKLITTSDRESLAAIINELKKN